jgi:peptidoglycan-associated lipoprotein
MTRTRTLTLRCLATAIALLAGCGGAAVAELPVRSAAAEATPRQSFTPGTSSTPQAQAACVSGTVYFAVDSSALDHAAREQLQCIQHGSARVNVVGMADPRGTEEYNLALGDRRARAVAEHLGRIGYDPTHVDTRSVGEETATGASDQEWARDRRANFVAQ